MLTSRRAELRKIIKPRFGRRLGFISGVGSRLLRPCNDVDDAEQCGFVVETFLVAILCNRERFLFLLSHGFTGNEEMCADSGTCQPGSVLLAQKLRNVVIIEELFESPESGEGAADRRPKKRGFCDAIHLFSCVLFKQVVSQIRIWMDPRISREGI